MSTALPLEPNTFQIKPMQSVVGESAEVLSRIYQPAINLACQKRILKPAVSRYALELVTEFSHFNIRQAVRVAAAIEQLERTFPSLPNRQEFLQDVQLLIEMYSCLFGLDEVGLRVQCLNRAMCPRFHTDKLGCRLVTTYLGPGTEWLEDDNLDRNKLGQGNGGLADTESGIYQFENQIQQANAGDLLLLKGAGWLGNESQAVVHRSPQQGDCQNRLVLTLDFA